MFCCICLFDPQDNPIFVDGFIYCLICSLEWIEI